ncbi:MAG: 4Fe-4S cluster-binding domain-containing protein [Defluviitaleaceae bacterium]|nr:4Fe-4S cluster-binding domain-containing protein [Defluviitaleaceae bacterium]MCL2274421.1 4Fe-4S cluster-binding domain-containing protein [Defluviitaleaceae bacterium]
MDNKKSYYIMPAGTIGAATYYVLQSGAIHGIKKDNVIGFIDSIKGRDNGADFLGLPVVTPDKANKDATVIVSSFIYGQMITQQLHDLGFDKIVQAETFLTVENTAAIMGKIAEDKVEERHHLNTIAGSLKGFFISTGNDLTLTKLEFIVTQRCTLKCKDCCALVQYYENPVDVETASVIQSIDRAFELIDNVRIVNIIGGEPLMVKNLSQIIDKLSQYNERIGSLEIITNGTIVPNDEVVAAMKRANMTIRISDYGGLAKNKDETYKKLTDNGVRCNIRKIWSWTVNKAFTDGSTDGEKTFHNCDAFCAQVLNGKLYYCSFVAHGDALRGFPHDENNYVDLFSDKVTKEVVKDYIKRTSAMPACQFCTGVNNANEPIPAAIQTKTALPYIKYME